MRYNQTMIQSTSSSSWTKRRIAVSLLMVTLLATWTRTSAAFPTIATVHQLSPYISRYASRPLTTPSRIVVTPPLPLPLATSSSSLASSTTTTLVEAPSLLDDTTTVVGPWTRVTTTLTESRQSLAALWQHKLRQNGVATALSYSLVSNAFTSIAVSMAWYTFGVRHGVSPIHAKKAFLAVYSGFYAINSLLKPLRLLLALSITPTTQSALQQLELQLNNSKKLALVSATAILLSTSAIMMGTGIVVASGLSQTPIFG